MYTSAIILIVILITYKIREKYSLWAANLVLALFWIGMSFFVAIDLNSDLKEGEIDIHGYRSIYGITYFFAVIGCGYLLPVMLGIGKKKKPKDL